MPNHADLTGVQLHEPKGVSGASAYEVYVADGAGSGSWEKITKNNLTGSGLPYVWLRVTNSSGGSPIKLPVLETGTIEEIVIIFSSSVASGASLVLRNNSTSTNTVYSYATSGTYTDEIVGISSGSLSNTSVTKYQYLSLTASASSGSVSGTFFIKVRVS